MPPSYNTRSGFRMSQGSCCPSMAPSPVARIRWASAPAECQEERDMSRVRVHNFSISLDGFGTGEGQSLESPFGHAGHRLNEWFFPTRTFQGMQGKPGKEGQA